MFLQMPIFFALFTVARSVPETASFFNIMPSIAMSARDALAAGGISAALVYILFDVAFGVLTLIPMLLNAKNTPEEQRQQGLTMGIMMSVMMLWFGWSVPAAVLLYYDTSALWQVIQQQVVTQRVTEKVKAETEAKLQDQPKEINVVRRERKPRPKKKG
jgi:YidC/Oxa1 family membrane protein insertase